MKPCTLSIAIETPGDVAVSEDGIVAICDMTKGSILIKELESDRTDSIGDVQDVRSVIFYKGGIAAACTFPRCIEFLQLDGNRSRVNGLSLPIWLDHSPLGEIMIAESGERKITKLSSDNPLLKSSFHFPAVQHLSSFATEGNRVWVAVRPNPGVIEFTEGSKIWRPAPKEAREFTGICIEKSSRGGILVLDRQGPRIWRYLQGVWSVIARLPAIYKRTRSLRMHPVGLWPYSIVDPPTSSVIWLGYDLSIGAIWYGQPFQRLIAQDSRTKIQIVEKSGVSRLLTSDGNIYGQFCGQARDFKILPNGDFLVVLRDKHCVLQINSMMSINACYGGHGELLYPCSADIHHLHQTLIVADPLRARLLEFAQDGRVIRIIPTNSSYVRWVRTSNDGTTWSVDVAQNEVTVFDSDFVVKSKIQVPFNLAQEELTEIQTLPGNVLLLGNNKQRLGITHDGWFSLDLIK